MGLLVSIIIPVYNGEKTIKESIMSVLNQTYTNFEIIIVNDGSTDSTGAIIEEFRNIDNILCVNQKNSGVSAARNNGINKSNGEYICFLDSDDLLDKLFLEKMVNKITSNNSDYCYCGYYKFTEKKQTKIFTRFSNNKVLLKYIKAIIRIPTGGWMLNKRYILQNNITFLEGVSWGEDVEFYYKVLSNSSNGSYVNEYLTYIRDTKNKNRLSNFTIEMIDSDYDFVMRVINNKNINKNNEIERALIEDRLSPLITNKLWKSFKYNYDIETIRRYYNKYRKYIADYYWNNGVRSLKLNLIKCLLNVKMK